MDKPRILIVDDEPSIRVALDRWFSLRGFDVEQAEDGQDALDKCRNHRYDVITMDLEMPRMGGLDAIVAIKKYLPDVPIVVLTGFMRDTENALSCGAAVVLTKPLRLRVLEAQVRELLMKSAC